MQYFQVVSAVDLMHKHESILTEVDESNALNNAKQTNI